MKRCAAFVLLSFSFLVYACNSATSPTSKEEAVATRQASAVPASLEPFADSLVRLDKQSLQSIATAADYYQRLVPTDSTLADSAAVLWLRQVQPAVEAVNEKLLDDTADYFELVYNGGEKAPSSQKAFQQKLAANHVLLLANGEGDVYAALDYPWAAGLLKQKTSTAVDAYLDLLTAGETKPALLDAGLAIEMRDLVNRVASAEKLLQQKLPARFAEDLRQKHRFYTTVLLFGSENSPAFDEGTLQLTPEFKEGYALLAQLHPTSEAAKRVAEWQAVLASKDRRKVEEWRRVE